MKKLFAVAILFLGIAVIAVSLSELETIASTLRRAHLTFFLIGILIQLAWFAILGRMYQSIYHLLGIKESVLTLSRIAAAANFINVVAPTAGVGGIALFAAEARRRGHTPGKVTVAAALFLLLDQAAFLCILALGWIVLVRRNDLQAGEISASLFLLFIACLYALVLYMGYRSEEKLGDILVRMARGVNRFVRFFRKMDYLSEARARAFAHEIAEGFSGLTEKPSSLVRPMMWGILNKILMMGILACAFLSYEVPFSAGTIVAGFSIGYLFFVVSPTPSGIGIVEGLMPLALTSLRVNWSQAVVITLTYRTLTFWVPFGMGAWAFRSLHRGGEEPSSTDARQDLP
ncbi:MAG: flippase-like domain-containing protein [Chloroflexi bacterium]|nr:flippase-like domain-containing protein [Chloroflexota bacterium]